MDTLPLRIALRAQLLGSADTDALIAAVRGLGWQIVEASADADIALIDLHPQPGDEPRTGLAAEAQLRLLITDQLEMANAPPLSGILLGVRRFGAVNATYGSDVGDAVLAQLAQRLAVCLQRHSGEGLRIGRFGGGNFLVLAQQSVVRSVWAALASELVEDMARPIAIDEHIIRLTARAGLAMSLPHEDAPSFLNRLGIALDVAAKRAGKRIKWADRSSDAVPVQGPALEIDLLKALERDEIQISFQPQFAVGSGLMTGAEALARWKHEEYGEIGAQTLFSIAERTDFIEPLSAHIAQKALTLAAQWPDSLAHLRLSLNVTANELASEQFLARMLGLLESTGFAADRLTLEITESALIDRLDTAAQMLHAAREAGLKTAIDDFGTGYSNFLYLKSLPLDYLKLDHGMTRELAGAPRDRIILRSIIALAKALDMQVIAEGVESDEQLAMLAEDGCDYFQGFLRAGAMASDDFVDYAGGLG